MWICILTRTPRILSVSNEIDKPAEYDSVENLLEDLKHNPLPPEDHDFDILALNTSTRELFPLNLYP